MKKIKALYLKFRLKLITLASLILIGIAILNIYFVLEVRVTSNDECLWIPKMIAKDSTAIFFDVVKVEGVTWNAGIRDGDQLIEIDKQVLNSTFHAQAILNEFDSGEYAEYKYIRDGKVAASNRAQSGHVAHGIVRNEWHHQRRGKESNSLTCCRFVPTFQNGWRYPLLCEGPSIITCQEVGNLPSHNQAQP